MIQKIDHLGIAVRSLDESVPYYENALGLKCEHREEVPSQKVRTAFFHCGEVHLELLEPTDPESPIAKFLEKKGEGFHHVAIAVDDIHAEMKRLKDAGFELLAEQPKQGADNKLICFLHPRSTNGLLVELCQDIRG